MLADVEQKQNFLPTGMKSFIIALTVSNVHGVAIGAFHYKTLSFHHVYTFPQAHIPSTLPHRLRVTSRP
jgi:hypothetical protein